MLTARRPEYFLSSFLNAEPVVVSRQACSTPLSPMVSFVSIALAEREHRK